MAQLVQQDSELITPEPRNDVSAPHARLKPLRHRDQELVADEVTESVVDVFEAVHVDEQRGEQPIPVSLRLRERAFEHLDEQRSIRQRRQRVVQRCLPQLLLGQMTFGHVGERPSHAYDPAVVAPDCDAPAKHPPVLAIAMTNAVLMLEVTGLIGAVRGDRRFERADVFGVDAPEPLHRVACRLVRRQPEHRLPPKRKVHDVVCRVPVPDAVVRTGQGKRVTLFADSQRFFCRRAVGNVTHKPGETPREWQQPDVQNAAAYRPP